jgi:hypothetical protein
MREHRERKAYLRVLWFTNIYNNKCPNKHVIIVDIKGKRVEGTEEKLEVCVVFFDKLNNCVPSLKLPIKAKPEDIIDKV